MSLAVRERPPLRTTTLITTPSGRRYRWAQDDPDAANVPAGQRHSDTMPGGFEQWSATLPRKPGVDYADLERLSTVKVKDATGRVIGEYRLDAVPRTSGDQMAVSPAAVGFQAALEDNKFAREIYRDLDLTRWREPSAQFRLSRDNTYRIEAVSTAQDQTAGPQLVTTVSSPWGGAPGRARSMGWYDASGIPIGSLYVKWQRGTNVNNADTNWTWQVFLASDDLATALDNTGNLRAAGPSSVTLAASDGGKRFAALDLFYADVANASNNIDYSIYWTRPAVYGTHGLTLRGSEPDAGFYASDIVTHAVETFAPSLRIRDGSVQQSSFVVPHLAFLEPTTAGEIVRQASRFDLPDWAVWEDRTFWWAERGAQARFWRARIGPSELEETGPQVDRLWESIVVQYQDVDGSTRTVGPPGSGADTESTDLKDFDPDNPANLAGIVRRDLLQMGTSTAAGATEVGRRFLSESRLLDRSGRARAVGYIEDDRGVLHPYHHVRAGDYVAFVDASDKSYRRIVRTEKDHDARTLSMDLDAPPEGLQALLERLGVVLVPLGVGS